MSILQHGNCEYSQAAELECVKIIANLIPYSSSDSVMRLNWPSNNLKFEFSASEIHCTISKVNEVEGVVFPTYTIFFFVIQLNIYILCKIKKLTLIFWALRCPSVYLGDTQEN